MWSGNQSRDSALGTRPDGEKHCNRNQLLRWAEFNECYCLCNGDFSMKPDNTYKGNFLWKRDLIVCSFVLVYYSHFNKFSVIYQHEMNIYPFRFLQLSWNFDLLVSSADNFCKQFGPRSGPTKCRAWSGSNLFDTQMVFKKEFFEKVDFEKSKQTTISLGAKS